MTIDSSLATVSWSLSTPIPSNLTLPGYCPPLPTVCPDSDSSFSRPAIPLTPEPLSLWDRVVNVFNWIFPDTPIAPFSIEAFKAAVNGNRIDALTELLQCSDEILAKTFNERGYFSDEGAIRFGFQDLLQKTSKEGNRAVVFHLLDRYERVAKKNEYGIDTLASEVLENAVEAGQRALAVEMLKRKYRLSIYSESKILTKAIEFRPSIALELLGFDWSPKCLEEGLNSAIGHSRPAIVCSLLDASEQLLPKAAIMAAKANRLDVLQETVRRGLCEKEALDALYAACDTNQKEAAHFLASQGSFFLKEKKSTAYLLETGFLPHRFDPKMLKGRVCQERASLLEAYLRFGKINDRELIDGWPIKRSERFSLLRSVLADRSSFSSKLQQFIRAQIAALTPDEQNLCLEIAVIKELPDPVVDSLIEASLLGPDEKRALSSLRQERKDRRRTIDEIKGQIGSPISQKPWDETEMRGLVAKNSADILSWKDGWQRIKNPDFVYFKSSDCMGLINSMPRLVLKSFYSLAEAQERVQKIERVRSACEKNSLNHLRVPRAFLVTELQNSEGKTVPVHLVVEELLPIAGHQFYEVKELLEELNQHEVSRGWMNQYFRELTSLVCKTGLTDLKPTNIPLLKDGSGLGIVDSSMLDSSIVGSLYAFGQEDHSLIDWLAPHNFGALRQAIEEDSSCLQGR